MMKINLYEFKGEVPEQMPKAKYWLIEDGEINRVMRGVQRQMQAINAAIEYQKENGNPVDKLNEILRDVIDDEDAWRNIVEEK